MSAAGDPRGAAALRRALRPLVHLVRSSDERHDVLWELRRRIGHAPSLPRTPVRTVLVVCFGNICRSPFAERLLAATCPTLEVRSGGFDAREGRAAEENAILVAREFGVDLSDHQAHRIGTEDVEWADLILGMTGRHHTMLRHTWPGGAAKMRMLGDFLATPPHAIPDPWGQPPESFRSVYAQIRHAADRLATRLTATDSSGAGRRR